MATLKVCAKLHILIVILIDLYVYLTVFQERPESNSYLLHDTFTLFNTNVFTPVSSNHYCVHKYVKLYFEEDHILC